ncbi:MAG: ABC-2 transporter permease [Oscillospiraceae bacterium]|nr:ABC-2 transporter permease [Oscillospiraceae bacterium]
MKTNNPMRGLLTFSFYAASGNMSIAALFTLAMSAALLITGNLTVYAFFVLVAVGTFPYTIMAAMGGKNAPKWEKFQLTMPVKRKDVVASIYLSVLLATIAGLLLAGIILGIGFVLHEGLLEHVLQTAFAQFAYVFGVVLIMAGLLFPIASTKAGESRGEAVFTGCLFAAGFIMILISWAGGRADILPWIISLSQVAIAVVVFVISYLLTKKMYAKMDF